VRYIIYVSQAVGPMSEGQLEALLIQSRSRNEEAAITGLLIYRYSADTDSGHFIQMLEGDEPALSDTFGRIAADRRHHSVLVLERGEVEGRVFRDWAMGFKHVDDALLASLPGYVRLGEATFNADLIKQTQRGALGLLEFFYDG
jgi:hypothetical protein